MESNKLKETITETITKIIVSYIHDNYPDVSDDIILILLHDSVIDELIDVGIKLDRLSDKICYILNELKK